MAKAKNAVAKSAKNSASVIVPDDLDLFADAGAGAEEMTKDDFQIPRINILQALSPQCQTREPTYIEGCEAGHFFNTVDEAPIDGEAGFLLIPVSYRKAYIEWRLRENGGGFVEDHLNNDTEFKKCKRDDKGKFINEAGNQIVETAEYFVLVYNPETKLALPACISMTGMQLKKSRILNTKLNQLRIPNPHDETAPSFNPAMFYSCYHASTIPESNDKGNWMGWKLERKSSTLELENGVEIYRAAAEFRKQIAAGEIKVAEEKTETVAPADADNAPM